MRCRNSIWCALWIPRSRSVKIRTACRLRLVTGGPPVTCSRANPSATVVIVQPRYRVESGAVAGLLRLAFQERASWSRLS